MSSGPVCRFPRARRGITLIECIVLFAILGILAALLMPALATAQRAARNTECQNNLRQLVAADLSYLDVNGRLPAVSPFVPTSISVARLRQLGLYLGVPVPEGEAINWPPRPEQPPVLNCPCARHSGHAEGMTVGGGLYTGYAYYGGLEESELVRSGLGTVVSKGHAADALGNRRGVLWADILTEFPTVDERRFEVFHTVVGAKRSADFRYRARDVDAINRGWSDGSVERIQIDLSSGSPHLRLQTFLGNFYF